MKALFTKVKKFFKKLIKKIKYMFLRLKLKLNPNKITKDERKFIEKMDAKREARKAEKSRYHYTLWGKIMRAFTGTVNLKIKNAPKPSNA